LELTFGMIIVMVLVETAEFSQHKSDR